MPPPHASLTPEGLARLAHAGVPAWVPRLLLPVLWFVAFVVALAGDVEPCTPLDPSICGPDPRWSALVVVSLATPVLLMWLPLVGCTFGVLYALIELGTGDIPSATTAFVLHGAVCAVVGVRLRHAAAAQDRIAQELASGATVTLPTPPRDADPRTAWSPWRLGSAALALLAGLGLLIWYGVALDAEAEHLARAVRVPAVVIAVDEDAHRMTFAAPVPGRGTLEFDLTVLDVTDDPRAEGGAERAGGATVPLLVDPQDAAWARLVAEPADLTHWLSAGLGAWLLAVVLVAGELRRRAALQVLWAGEHPAWRVTIAPTLGGDALLRPAGHRDVPADPAVAPVGFPFRWSEASTGDGPDPPDPENADAREEADEELSAEESAALFGRFWRGEIEPDADPFRPPPRDAVLVGSLREGGWVLALDDDVATPDEGPWVDGMLVPSGPLRIGESAWDTFSRTPTRMLARLPVGPWRNLPVAAPPMGPPGLQRWVGEPVRAEVRQRVPELPATLRTTRWERRIGAAMLAAALIGGPVAVVWFAADASGFERALALLTGIQLVIGGVGRLVTRIELDREGLRIVTGARRFRIAWYELHGVRREGHRLALAWHPDRTLDLPPLEALASTGDEPADGDRAAAAERLGAVMLRLRDVSPGPRTGTPQTAERARPGPVWAASAAYLMLLALIVAFTLLN